MPRFNLKKLDEGEKEELLNHLFEAVKKLKTKQDIINFFRDLLSESEAIMLARRLAIARSLAAGKGYYEIREELGASFDTINSVGHFLDYGSKGYKRVIEN